MREEAKVLAEIINKQYELRKYSPLFTLPGFCFYWNETEHDFRNEPTISSFNRIMNEVFKIAKEHDMTISKPKLYIPRTRDEATHYALMAMRNQGIVSEVFASLSEDKSISPIISDSRILNEAGEKYIKFCSKNKGVDFFRFLISYREGEEFDESQSKGQFSNLLERLVIRFEDSEDVLSSINSIMQQDIYLSVASTNASALESRKQTINTKLLEASKKYAITPRVRLSENDDSSLTPKNVFGRRRVKVGSGCNGSYIDLELYADRIRRKGEIRFNPNAILEQRLVDSIIQANTCDFKKDPQKLIDTMEDEARKTENEFEAKALNTVLELFRYVLSFESCEKIHHKMIIARRKI